MAPLASSLAARHLGHAAGGHPPGGRLLETVPLSARPSATFLFLYFKTSCVS
jgi:hypothetical protein